MNKPAAEPRQSRPSYPWKRITLVLCAAALISFMLFAHPFLAVTQRVDADLLVVEGWIPDYMLLPAAKEFQQGRYSLFLVSGLQNDPETHPTAPMPDTLRTVSRLEAFGVPRAVLLPCPAPFARWLRTSKTAIAVRDKIAERGLKPRGINVITAGPHARETWVAYQHAFGDKTPVGVISIPKNNYPANRWWLSRQGLIWVPKDFVAWLKEVVFGLRS